MATDSNNKDRFSARGSRRELEKRDRFRKLLIAVNIILVLILFPAGVWGKQVLAAGEELMPASAYYDAGGHGEYDDQLNGEASSPERGSAASGQVSTGTAPATAGQVPNGTAPATAGQVLTEAGQMEIRRAGKAFMPDITILLIFASMFIIFACAVIVRTEFERGKKRRRKRA